MKEIFEQLLSEKNIKINKIISPINFKSEDFIQEEDEFIYLIQGKATLLISGEIKQIKMGEYLFIKGGTTHKILSTSNELETIWLTVHIT